MLANLPDVTRSYAPIAMALLLGATPAAAGERHRSESKASKGGALSQVVGGLRAKSGNSGPKSSPRHSSAEDPDDDSFSETWDDSDSGWTATSAMPGTSLSLGVRAPSGLTDLDFTAGAQLVRHSDVSFGGEARFSYQNLSISVANRTYAESVPGEDPLVFTTWRGTLGYRLVMPERGSLTLDVGPAGAYSDGLNLVGAVVGLSARAAAADLVAVDGAIHAYSYTHDTSAVELSGGARLSILRVGYRWLRFNVGPPLHGPEVGLAVSF